MTPDDLKNHTTEAAVLLAAGKAMSGQILELNRNDRDWLVVPKDHEVREVTTPRATPLFLTQQVSVDNVASLAEYVKLFSPAEAPTAVAFARITAREEEDPDDEIRVILDYHAAPTQPSFNRHVVTMTLRTTARWDEWADIEGVYKNQLDFAQFIETHMYDIGAPNGAVLHEMVLKFEAMKAVAFKAHHRLEDGSVQLQYTEDVQGSAQDKAMKIPNTLALMLTPFAGMPPRQIEAKLRYRVTASGLTLAVFMPTMSEVYDVARQELSDQAKTALGAHVRGYIIGEPVTR
jgi:hypothetical protein